MSIREPKEEAKQENKKVTFFRSITPREKEKYFIVETVRDLPQQKHNNNHNNAHQNQHSNAKFQINSAFNVTNFIPKKEPQKKVEHNKKIFTIPKQQNTEKDIKTKTIDVVNNLIEKNKLHFNEIWTSKITQEELNLPKAFSEVSNTIELNKNIFSSIINLSKYINELFQKLITNDDDGLYSTILSTLACLKQKIKIFYEIKSSQFKIGKENTKDIFSLQKNLSSIKKALQEDISSNIKDIISVLDEFCSFINPSFKAESV